MNCAFSREILALYIEDDLPSADAIRTVESHVAGCVECRQYCDQLRESQTFIKSRFRPVHAQCVSQEMLAGIRRGVMTQIVPPRRSLGWNLRLERFFVSLLRTPRYAAVAFSIVAIVSASLLGQIGSSSRTFGTPAAMFLDDNNLLYPANYREWVLVGSRAGHSELVAAAPDDHNVYIDPAAYSEFTHSGKFPDGTIMVLESELQGLKASVKDSNRFDGGWGFYDFAQAGGKSKAEAEALPSTAGCLACHRDKAATDHVFTQFYPVLKYGTVKL
jgi:hypothetical protein